MLGPGQGVSGSANLVARLGRRCGVRGVRAPSLARHKGAALRQPPPFHHLSRLSRPLSAPRRASSRPVPWRGNKEQGFQCWGKRSGAPQDASPDPGPPRRAGADGGRSRARSHATFLLPHRVYSDEDRGLDMARGERTPPNHKLWLLLRIFAGFPVSARHGKPRHAARGPRGASSALDTLASPGGAELGGTRRGPAGIALLPGPPRAGLANNKASASLPQPPQTPEPGHESGPPENEGGEKGESARPPLPRPSGLAGSPGAPCFGRLRSFGTRPRSLPRRAGHAVAAAAGTVPATCARGVPGARSCPGRPTLPLAVPPLTPMRKGSPPPLGCWWLCRLSSLSPAMARAPRRRRRRPRPRRQGLPLAAVATARSARGARPGGAGRAAGPAQRGRFTAPARPA